MMNLGLLLALLCSMASGQRFLRQGFSNRMDSDFQGEMKLDENDSLSGLTREMFLMQNVDWELEPPSLEHILDPKLKKHIRRYMNQPIQLKLMRKKGRYGLRAVGYLNDGKMLRAFWREGTSGIRTLKSTEFLEVPYDEAVRSRLFNVEFEVQLPPMKKGSKDLPSVVYQIPMEAGSMNPKAMVPRGAGKVVVYPTGHEKSVAFEAGRGYIGISMRAGLIDPSWAKGRAIFRKGRSTGLI
jgi:hypothetical protein